MTTADIEKEKALKSRSQPTEVLNTETQAPERFGEGGEETSGNYVPQPKQTFKDNVKNFLGNIGSALTTKGTSMAEKQRAKAIENSAAPEQRFDLAGNTLEKANEEGLAANRAIQNTEIPKWKRMTLNDILFNPEYDSIRGSIVSQAINARGANFLKGLAGKDSNYASAIDRYNKEQADRYSNAIADRDIRAADVQMSDIEAANKRDVGETLQRADFNVDRELDRKGLLFDTETKRQVLLKMGENAKEFNELYPNPEDRMLLTAYQQYLGGDATMLDSLRSIYGPQLVEKLSLLVNKLMGGNADGTEDNTPVISFGGHDYTLAELENLGSTGIWDAMTRAGLLDEEKEQNIAALERRLGTGNEVKKLRDTFEKAKKGQSLDNAYKEQLVAETNERARTLEEDISAIVNNANLNENQKKKKLADLKSQLEGDKSKNLLADTTSLKTATANLDNAIAKNNLAIEVKSINKPLQNNVKLSFDKGNLNKKDADFSLNYLATLNWNKLINENTGSVTNREQKLEAVMGTTGYKDVVDFLRNPKVQAYAYDKNAGKNYKYTVNNFCQTFGGTPKDYGFLDVTW